MNRRNITIAIGVVVIGVGGYAYLYLLGGNGVASAPISAPTLVANSGSSANGTDSAASGTDSADSASGTSEAGGTGGTQRRFSIAATSSNVQFTLTEVLLGNPNTVVGKTNQVAGDILVDLDQPSKSQIGTIRIDARTFATDSPMRDRMIRGPILASSQDQFEFINFVPTAVTGLPDKIVAGQAYTFQVVGDMTVHGVTKPATFDVSAKLVSGTPDHLDGTATTTVMRADYNLQIPKVQTVADVSDAVKLEIDFVAPEASANATASATQAATA